MQERRSYARSELLYYSRVFDGENGDLIGHLGNITPHGLMIISEGPLELVSTYKLRVEIPDELGDKTYLDLSAESLWCIPDFNPEAYNTGFRLLDTSAEDSLLIEQMVEEYQYQR